MFQSFKFFTKVSSLFIIGSFFSYGLYAQDSQQLEVAVVDTDLIYKELPSYSKLQAELVEWKKDAQDQITAITENNKSILESYQENQKRLDNIDIGEAYRQEIMPKQEELAQQIQQIQRYISQEQYRLQTSIQTLFLNQVSKDKQALRAQLADLAQKNGYAFLLDKSFVTGKQLSLVHYHADRFEKTEFFLSLLLTE